MVQIVCRYSNETAFFNRLRALGFNVNTDDPKFTGRDEDRIEDVTTPTLVDVDNFEYLTFECTESQADKLPNNDQNPAFTAIWRSDEDDISTWPMVTVTNYDIDRNPDGTRQQGVGKIA